MNERIRQLEDACWEELGEDECYYTVFNKEKFAELIIKECQFAIVSRTDLPRHERKLYNNVLKKHFGIEE